MQTAPVFDVDRIDRLARHVEFNANPNDRFALRKRHVFNTDAIRCLLLAAKSIKLEDNECFRQASLERRLLVVCRNLFLSVRGGEPFSWSSVTRAINGRHSIDDCIDWVAIWGAFAPGAVLREFRGRYWVRRIDSNRLKDCGLGAHRLIQYAEEIISSADSSYHRDSPTRSAAHDVAALPTPFVPGGEAPDARKVSG